MNVDDLLDETDSEDSEDNDDLLQGDPDLEKIRRKAGLTNSVLNAAVGGIGSSTGSQSTYATSSNINRIAASKSRLNIFYRLKLLIVSGADSSKQGLQQQFSLLGSISSSGQQ